MTARGSTRRPRPGRRSARRSGSCGRRRWRCPPRSPSRSHRGGSRRGPREASPAREADQAERRHGNAGHGVDVAQGVRRGDRAEVVRAVDDRREKIGREDQGEVVAEPINGRVVGRCMPDDHVGVGDLRQGGQKREQIIRRLFGREPARLANWVRCTDSTSAMVVTRVSGRSPDEWLFRL